MTYMYSRRHLQVHVALLGQVTVGFERAKWLVARKRPCVRILSTGRGQWNRDASVSNFLIECPEITSGYVK